MFLKTVERDACLLPVAELAHSGLDEQHTRRESGKKGRIVTCLDERAECGADIVTSIGVTKKLWGIG